MAEAVLKRKKRAQNGHRKFVKKTLVETKRVSHDMDEESRRRLYHLKSTLMEQLEALTKMHSEILDLVNEHETIEDEWSLMRSKKLEF